MMRRECPCRYCTKDTGRYPGCHDHCEKPEYQDWRKQERERKERERQEKGYGIAYQEVKCRNIVQTKKRARIK